MRATYAAGLAILIGCGPEIVETAEFEEDCDLLLLAMLMKATWKQAF